MPTVILTFLLFSAFVLLMVVGVFLTGRSLKGSCGGPNCDCVAEGKDVLSCDARPPGRYTITSSDSRS